MMFNSKTLFKRKANKNSGHTSTDELYSSDNSQSDFSRIEETKKNIQNQFGNSSDFTITPLLMGQSNGMVVYLNTMIDKNLLAEYVVTPLKKFNNQNGMITTGDLESFRKDYLSGLISERITNFHQLTWCILSGYAVIIVDGICEAIGIEIGNAEKRPITEPSTQTVIRGPKDSFTESLQTNISLIRRRIKNPNVRFTSYVIGKDTRTSVSIGYIEGITNQDILDEVTKRVEAIETSSILDSGNIEEYIADKSFTPFPMSNNTERPDAISAGLIEGRIAILVDGSPFVLQVPSVMTDFFKSSEDYYQPFFMASFIRLIRYMSFMIALVLPSLYVAITTYHQELMPTQLLISVQAQREGVPFPAVFEILMMELTFEVLREAGIRMPRAVGQTVSIVGALVIGQAAVEAGLVSNVLVIIVAFTAIASFVSPIYNFSISTRLLRFVLIIGASLLGLYGILIILILMVVHLTSLRSFGVPYLTPVAPLIIEDQKDLFVRFPIWNLHSRPAYLKSSSPKFSEETKTPAPPEGNNGGEV